jgi:methylenetetrahydrofolate dehydrogenase (NADP+)/methenyltetrahydrofolate cyclohydrolase
MDDMTNVVRIDGKAMAANLSAQVVRETEALLKEHDLTPGLADVIIGEDPASQVYVRNKKRTAESCGFHSVQHTLDADASQDDVLALIDDLNNDASIHGILVQLPLPKHLDEQVATQAVAPSKDVDGFHFINIGKLTSGNTADAFITKHVSQRYRYLVTIRMCGRKIASLAKSIGAQKRT